MSVERVAEPARAIESTTREFAECVLCRFRWISVERFHKLAFLIETEYLEKHGERLTSATYEVVMDGCFSEDLKHVVDDFEEIERTETRVGGSNVLVLQIEDGLNCSMDKDASTIIDSVIDSLAEAPGKELDSLIQKNLAFQGTHIGEEIDL